MKKLALAIVDSLFLLRLPLLVPVWTILLLGWITGHEDGGVGWRVDGWDRAPCMGGLLTAFLGFSLIVAAIYVVNQIADIQSDRINRKLFLLPRGIISVRTAWVLAVVCCVGGMTVALGAGPLMAGLFGAGALLGYLYNLPPARLKDRAIGGVIANCLGHGTVTYLVGWCAAKCGTCAEPQILWSGILSSLSPAFANGAVFLATTIPDCEGDRVTGKQTFCVRYGARYTGLAAAMMCVGALLTSALMQHRGWVMAVPTALSLVFFARLARTARRENAYAAFRLPVLFLSLCVVAMVPLYGVLLGTTFLVSRTYYRRRFGIEYPAVTPK